MTQPYPAYLQRANQMIDNLYKRVPLFSKAVNHAFIPYKK